jgi:hypothetical protein
MTAGGRLPDVVIAGAQKSGTTTLHTWLRDHPAMFMSSPKELHFFDLHPERGADWYREQFAGAGDEQLAGESTPEYLYLPEARARMSATLPDARLVLLLRDPVPRAYSHYHHMVSRGRETLPFGEALRAEAARLAEGDVMDRINFSYLDRGRYVTQLEQVLTTYPRDRVHVELFEDLRDHPRATFRRVAGFLGIDADAVPPAVGSRTNRYKSSRLRRLRRRLPKWVRLGGAVALLDRLPNKGYPPMADDARALLLEALLPERDRLAELTHLDLSRWVR